MAKQRQDTGQRNWSMLCTVLLVLTCLWAQDAECASWSHSQQVFLEPPKEHVFTLRHVFHHGLDRHPGLLRRFDAPPLSAMSQDVGFPVLTAKSQLRPIHRSQNRKQDTIEAYLHHSRHDTLHMFSIPMIWEEEEISMPNITDKETVVTLAKMTADAYVQVPNTGNWQEVGAPWNVSNSSSLGWEKDGLRGHIFMDESNTTVVVGLKGTSLPYFDSSDTTTNDQINDNLLFSCCCARIGIAWTTVCDCYTSTYSCSSTCLKDELIQENRYYRAALNIYYNVTKLYPDKDIWLTGHSLGGSVSSLLGLTYGLPVVTFEAPGEDMAAKRIGLPEPPGGRRANSGAYHFGNNADPLFMGTCNGVSSFCSIGGYAMESKCHSGNVCLYDTVRDFGWRTSLSYHKILPVIKEVLMKYDEAAVCIPEDVECTDCYNWKFHEGNGSSTSSTSTSSTFPSTTTTGTSTCQHPGWWGCLDETTTIESTTTTSTSTSITTTTTSICSRYGWFGQCLDDDVPTSSATLTSTTTSSSTTVTTHVMTTAPASTGTSVTCETPGYIWGCRNRDTQTFVCE